MSTTQDNQGLLTVWAGADPAICLLCGADLGKTLKFLVEHANSAHPEGRLEVAMTETEQTPQRLCNAQHGPHKIGNVWTTPFYCDKPYGHEDRHESGFPEDRFTWFVSPDPTIGQVLTEQTPQQPQWEKRSRPHKDGVFGYVWQLWRRQSDGHWGFVAAFQREVEVDEVIDVLAKDYLNAQQQRIQAAERELEEATVKLAYVNVWWQMADADVESVTRESVVDLSKVLDGRDRTWLEEANAKTYRIQALEAALLDLVGIIERLPDGVMKNDAGKTPETPRWTEWRQNSGGIYRMNDDWKHPWPQTMSAGIANEYEAKVTHLEGALREAEARAKAAIEGAP